MLKSGDN